MRFNSIKWLLPIVALALLASWQGRGLADYRRAHLPATYSGGGSDVPPGLAFVMAGLGGFRGVATEILWFRVHRLQEQGRYMELVQLADWLTMLDPHASEAWVYNAWNLAYNISVMMGRPEDRLRWVNNGIALIRDEGLRFNPREARLYRELAWLYQNKIGDSMDDAHLAYKLDLVQKMAPYLNPDGTVRNDEASRAQLAAMRLDIARMRELERRFGPLDWRLAQTHAVYWASQGVEFATGGERLMCRRALYQPLILLVFNGRLAGDPTASGAWRTAPNPAMALPVADFLAQTRQEFPTEAVRGVYIRFLLAAIRALYNPEEGEDFYTSQIFQRFKAELGERAARLTIRDIVDGWQPEDGAGL